MTLTAQVARIVRGFGPEHRAFLAELHAAAGDGSGVIAPPELLDVVRDLVASGFAVVERGHDEHGRAEWRVTLPVERVNWSQTLLPPADILIGFVRPASTPGDAVQLQVLKARGPR